VDDLQACCIATHLKNAGATRVSGSARALFNCSGRWREALAVRARRAHLFEPTCETLSRPRGGVSDLLKVDSKR
jgi:hypothetical protein